MKKILLTIFGVLFSVQLAFAALSASTVWEVRTTGDALNGGGYVSGGTDYSQQDAAQLALTDIYFTSGVTIKSDTGGFTAAMVGNLIYIASGTHFTAGYYQIATRVDTNTVTLDRAAASEDTSAHKDGAGKVGGATNHPQTIAPSVVAGNTIYIASGTYVKVGANEYVLRIAVAGSGMNVIQWIGYVTNHSTVAYGANRPVFDGANNTTNCIIASYGGNGFKNIWCKRATGNGIGDNSNGYVNVRSSNNGGIGIYAYNNSFSAFSCELDNNTGKGAECGGNYQGANLYYSYIHDNSNIGVNNWQDNGGGSVFYCVADSNTGTGFLLASLSSRAIGSISYGNTGASTDGFYTTNDALGSLVWVNNISMNNGRYGFNADAAIYQSVFDYNSYYGNATAGLNNITAGSHDITTDPLFTAPTANPPDFTLQSASPCKDAGFPDADWAVNVGLADARY